MAMTSVDVCQESDGNVKLSRDDAVDRCTGRKVGSQRHRPDAGNSGAQETTDKRPRLKAKTHEMYEEKVIIEQAP